jgi:hypothetical protein
MLTTLIKQIKDAITKHEDARLTRASLDEVVEKSMQEAYDLGSEDAVKARLEAEDDMGEDDFDYEWTDDEEDEL